MKIQIFASSMLFLLSCAEFDEECGNRSYAPLEGYEVGGYDYTPEGIHVDAPDNYDLSVVDRLTNEVYFCLQQTFPSLYIPDHIASASWCYPRKIRLFRRSCLEVKVPAEWRVSSDGMQQTLFDQAPEASCSAKGFTGSCYWRAGLQQEEDSSAIIVTTPSLYLYKDPLLRYITNCDYPWQSLELAYCMDTTTGPLDLNLRSEN